MNVVFITLAVLMNTLGCSRDTKLAGEWISLPYEDSYMVIDDSNIVKRFTPLPGKKGFRERAGIELIEGEGKFIYKKYQKGELLIYQEYILIDSDYLMVINYKTLPTRSGTYDGVGLYKRKGYDHKPLGYKRASITFSSNSYKRNMIQYACSDIEFDPNNLSDYNFQSNLIIEEDCINVAGFTLGLYDYYLESDEEDKRPIKLSIIDKHINDFNYLDSLIAKNPDEIFVFQCGTNFYSHEMIMIKDSTKIKDDLMFFFLGTAKEIKNREF